MDNNIQPELAEPIIFPSLKQCFIIMGIMVLASIVFSPITVMAKLLHFDFFEQISFFLYYLLVFGSSSLLVYLYKKTKEQHTYIDPLFRINDLVLIPLVLIVAIALQIGVSIPIISLIPIPEFVKAIFESMNKDMNNTWVYIAVVVLAPIFEEYIFRGVMLDGLLKKFSPTKAILISSLLFGLIHFNPWQFVSAMVIGIFAGWIYYRTKNLMLCILIHFANNGWAVLSSYIFSEDDATTIASVSQFIYIIPALLVAAVCIYLLKIRIYPKEDKESVLESDQ